MSDDFTAVVERARTHATVSMADASVLLGRSRNRAYEDVRRTGHLAGIPAIRVSERSIRVPSLPLLRLVGLAPDPGMEVDDESR